MMVSPGAPDRHRGSALLRGTAWVNSVAPPAWQSEAWALSGFTMPGTIMAESAIIGVGKRLKKCPVGGVQKPTGDQALDRLILDNRQIVICDTSTCNLRNLSARSRVDSRPVFNFSFTSTAAFISSSLEPVTFRGLPERGASFANRATPPSRNFWSQ